MSSNLGFFEPKSQQRSIRFGNTKLRIQQISHCNKDKLQELLVDYYDYIVQALNWCTLVEISVLDTTHKMWLERCGFKDNNIKNKKIRLLMREEKKPHVHLKNQYWYKMAIEDMETNEILFRSIHNVGKKDESCYLETIQDKFGDWYLHVGKTYKKPSTLGTDKEFWLRLKYIL
jgi:hypothetical protein